MGESAKYLCNPANELYTYVYDKAQPLVPQITVGCIVSYQCFNDTPRCGVVIHVKERFGSSNLSSFISEQVRVNPLLTVMPYDQINSMANYKLPIIIDHYAKRNDGTELYDNFDASFVTNIVGRLSMPSFPSRVIFVKPDKRTQDGKLKNNYLYHAVRTEKSGMWCGPLRELFERALATLPETEAHTFTGKRYYSIGRVITLFDKNPVGLIRRDGYTRMVYVNKRAFTKWVLKNRSRFLEPHVDIHARETHNYALDAEQYMTEMETIS